MDYKFFDGLTREEAEEYLAAFLEFGRNPGMKILEQNIHFTIEIDFCVKSLPAILKALLTELKTVPKEPDPSVPEFIKNTEIYKRGLFDFDEASKSIVLAASYYLGETFVRNFRQLSWSIGNVDYTEGNMPVVTGFKFNKQLAPILIVENMFRGTISGISLDNSIETAIEVWSTKFF